MHRDRNKGGKKGAASHGHDQVRRGQDKTVSSSLAAGHVKSGQVKGAGGHGINMSGFGLKSHAANQETIEEALVDLYLSVKIRSNEEVSCYMFFRVHAPWVISQLS